ncbi:hypothetical protein OPV22_008637 [Ensete ventricosum]|uniref:Uncharacterized protein n=1 Tax=Ensete ventricosum TaxID=4639 RepID=A0AAV8PPK9_ENSVE|nr:hypothetical protein OPV22_008637 [Ensete ventricosum]
MQISSTRHVSTVYFLFSSAGATDRSTTPSFPRPPPFKMHQSSVGGTRRRHSPNPHQARHRLPWGSEPSASHFIKLALSDGYEQKLVLRMLYATLVYLYRSIAFPPYKVAPTSRSTYSSSTCTNGTWLSWWP